MPDFFTSLGARFTVTLARGSVYPQALRAHRILERASSTMASGMLTMLMPGMPEARLTSAVTATASTPRSTAVCTLNVGPISAHPRRMRWGCA